MVTITVIGWYGTETIGDRAIFSGLLRVFSGVFNDYCIQLGALHIHFTERTLLEDYEFYQDISDRKVKRIEIFDSLNAHALRTNIRRSDLLVVGGGPLMDLTCMFMLEFSLRYAHRHHVKSCLLGCGWGPLKEQMYIRSALQDINYSDLIIFRDSTSLHSAVENGASKKMHALIDPAFFAAQYYAHKHSQNEESDYIAVNFRDVTIDGTYEAKGMNVKSLTGIVMQLLDAFPQQDVRLIPMHTFYVGGDDRIILEQVKNSLHSSKVSVQHIPLSLENTMGMYRNASICLGMRFHSIVLQSVLNGKNYILDYTDSRKGKIRGMLEQLNLTSQLEGRYIHLSQSNKLNFSWGNIKKFVIDDGIISTYFNSYVQLIEQIVR